MGAILSTVRIVYALLKDQAASYRKLMERLSASPGVPQLNSSHPYWIFPPSPIAQHGAQDDLPSEADVVIIGSGITGTAVARELLRGFESEGNGKATLSVVMLEARDVCSGATGRNGGHISPNVYNEYTEIAEAYGEEAALDILKFRLAHINVLLKIAEQEGLLDVSQARLVDEYDVYLDQEFFHKSKQDLEAFLKVFGPQSEQHFRVLEGTKNMNFLQLSARTKGCIAKPGAAIHPYRFVTAILSNLLAQYPDFHLFSRTPCTAITSSPSSSSYVVTTPRGEIQTRHVVHATNAWTSHLLPGLRKKIVPLRAHMSTHRAGQALFPPLPVEGDTSGSWVPGARAFVFYVGNSPAAFDYLTQLLSRRESLPNPSSQPDTAPNAYYPSDGEMMFGGGASLGGRSTEVFMDNLGISDDSDMGLQVASYLSGALPYYFKDWGREGAPGESDGDVEDGWGLGRVKALWTGIIGISADTHPWVGRVPVSVSGRAEPRGEPFQEVRAKLSGPGEWISAGYTGEGMVHAWLCGTELASMILERNVGGEVGKEDHPLPRPFLITEARVSQANIENLAGSL